jgi:hypothetical protein
MEKGMNVNEIVIASIQSVASKSRSRMLLKVWLLAIKNMILVTPKKNMPVAMKKIKARMNSGGTIRFNFTRQK